MARIAAMVAKGHSGTAIAAELNDGTTPNQVASMAGQRPRQLQNSEAVKLLKIAAS